MSEDCSRKKITLFEFTRNGDGADGGDLIWLNPEHIVVVEPCGAGQTTIGMTNATAFRVDGCAEDIVENIANTLYGH